MPRDRDLAHAYKHADLFETTMRELNQEAPAELLRSLRERLEYIRTHSPNSAQTAEACLLGLASDKSTLLHVLTAAYLANGGVMLKYHPTEESVENDEDRTFDFDFKELEAELNRMSSSDTHTKSDQSSSACSSSAEAHRQIQTAQQPEQPRPPGPSRTNLQD